MRLNEILFYGRQAEDVLSMFSLNDDLPGLQGCKVLGKHSGVGTRRLANARLIAHP